MLGAGCDAGLAEGSIGSRRSRGGRPEPPQKAAWLFPARPSRKRPHSHPNVLFARASDFQRVTENDL